MIDVCVTSTSVKRQRTQHTKEGSLTSPALRKLQRCQAACALPQGAAGDEVIPLLHGGFGFLNRLLNRSLILKHSIRRAPTWPKQATATTRVPRNDWIRSVKQWTSISDLMRRHEKYTTKLDNVTHTQNSSSNALAS